MERALRLTGIGGQGIQLAGQILARAAVHEDRHVLALGTYGGTMRGGSTDYTLVVADTPIETPPIVPHLWAALAMHGQFFAPVRARLEPGALVAIDASLFEGELDREAHHVLDVPATHTATGLGSALAASLVLTGAFAAWSGLVGIDALVAAMVDSVPAYRRANVAGNERALRAGFGSVGPEAPPAWSARGAA